jgi:hypothetical protein
LKQRSKRLVAVVAVVAIAVVTAVGAHEFGLDQTTMVVAWWRFH